MISAGKKTSFALISVVLTFVMIISGAVASFAADSGITGSKVATPTELSDSVKETEVTLQIPAVKETDEYDIVFVMDDSSSTSLASGLFINRITELFNGIVAQGVDVNVGVVKFRGITYDAISLASSGAYEKLVKYDPATTASVIMDGINLPKASFTPSSRGTNVHGALKVADKWLSEDADVANTHKYVILLSDLKTYIWD